ncbi:trehalase-like [Chrysoperla carnea]|uniref:trehalase-like n=1 Tax=Chrysoperla carnea TaxID=189513 RepID=UPI001D0858B1|nr:trehalase-like [Chrysoperla carnea]
MVDVESTESSKDIRANLDNKVNEINPVCQCKKCINIEAPDDSTKQPCSSRVYCYGPLLHEVQTTQPHLYRDSKSFVDMRMRNSEIETLRNFNKLMNETNCKPSRDQLSEFVNKTFEEVKELDEITPEDFNKSPPFLNNIKDPELKKFASFLNEMWPELARKVPNEAKTKSKQYSILPVPYTFVVPGGRFREPYYWDSYWIISGLLICEMKDTARDMLKNFFWFVDKYGFVLNGGRIYYEKRSQPPLLAHMVYLYVKKTNDKKFLEEKVGENTNIQLLEKELVFWSKNSKISVKGNTLLRYYVDVEGPRPEGYREDYIMTDNATDSLKYLYKEFKSAAESGWDYSSRWFANPDTDRSLKNLKVTNIAPVDLNAFYCGGLDHLTELYSLLGNTAKSEEWKKKGDEFRESIYKVLWSETDGIWFDVDITTGEHRKQFYPSNMSPLWTKVIHASQSSADVANRVAQYLNGTKEFHLPGGVPASNINTSQQWDYPNVWPPLIGYMVEGLQNSDSDYAKELAFELTERWIYSNYLSYDSGKRMYEKYHCEFPGQRGAGGEYTVQFGFGWTNGVILEMLNVYGDRLSLTAIKERVEQLMQSKT